MSQRLVEARVGAYTAMEVNNVHAILRTDRVAIFIDCDNLPPVHLEEIERIGSTLGQIVKVTGYGIAPVLKDGSAWSNVLEGKGYALARTEFNSVGKNATDIALSLDALADAMAKKADIFCIASKDKDFAHVSFRLRQLGKRVYFIGGSKRIAGRHDIHDGIFLLFQSANGAKSTLKRKSDKTYLSHPPGFCPEVIAAVIRRMTLKKQFVTVSALSVALRKEIPNFRPSMFGLSRLSTLLSCYSDCEVVPISNKKHAKKVRMVG